MEEGRDISWIVQYLIRNKVKIRTSQNIDSDELDDLLVVEGKIKDLCKDGLLSDMDIYIIDLVSDGRPLRELEKSVDKNRVTISRVFLQICDRISYFLGGYFTDEGFLDNMKKSYKLSDEEVEELKLYMSGKFKHQLMRNSKK